MQGSYETQIWQHSLFPIEGLGQENEDTRERELMNTR